MPQSNNRFRILLNFYITWLGYDYDPDGLRKMIYICFAFNIEALSLK